MGMGGSKGLNPPPGNIICGPFSWGGRGPNSPKPGGPFAKTRSKSNMGKPCGKGSGMTGCAIGTCALFA